MGATLRQTVGAVLFVAGLAGLVLLAFGPRRAVQLEATRLAVRVGLLAPALAPAVTPLTPDEVRGLTQAADAPASDSRAEQELAAGPRPGFTPRRLRIARIGLDSEVVPARLVRLASGAVTWEVPAYRVGHAQGTAGAGEDGNMVLLGHVSSVNAGNVFAALDRVQVGDEIVAQSSGANGADGAVVYRVAERRLVARDDLSVLAPAGGPVATLITCAGAWLPAEQDYSHRLVVRGTPSGA